MTVGDWLILIALGAAIWRLGDLVALGRRIAADVSAGSSEQLVKDLEMLGKQVDHVGVAVIDLNRDVANLQREIGELNRTLAKFAGEMGRLNPAPAAELDQETANAMKELVSLAKELDRS